MLQCQAEQPSAILPGVVLFASYAGVLGGAERVLLDCVTRLERPLAVACPQGPLAAALRDAGIEHMALEQRPLRRGARHVLGLARELGALPRPDVLVAWGARATMAAAIRPRSPVLAVHHDLFVSAAV